MGTVPAHIFQPTLLFQLRVVQSLYDRIIRGREVAQRGFKFLALHRKRAVKLAHKNIYLTNLKGGCEHGISRTGF